jgi:hypothetical protein
MRVFLTVLFILLLAGRPSAAQEISARVAEPLTDRETLPNSPVAKIEPTTVKPTGKPDVTDENSMCPAGVGKPCALLGGRKFYPDLWHMREHDRNWGDAMKHPAMIGISALLLASTVLDIEGVDHCLPSHGCSEENPLFPRGVDRPRQYATAMSINALAIYGLGYGKRRGKGNRVFITLLGASFYHLGQAIAEFESDTPSTAASSTVIWGEKTRH